MAKPEKNFLQQTIDWISGAIASVRDLAKRVGWPLTALIVLAATGGFTWWNWDDIAKRPGVEWILQFAGQRPLPKATAGRLTIAVTHLARDNKDRQHEGILLDELEHFEVEGVKILPVDRTVDPEEPAKKNAEDKAQDLLKKTGADVLIWGSVVSLSGKSASAMRLNWTRAPDVPGAKASEKYQLPTETIALPAEFWSDLKQILGLLTQSRIAELTFGQPGTYVAAKLEPLIRQVRALVEKKEGIWDPETLAGVRFGLATALAQYGEQSGTNEPLAESIALYRKDLEEYTRARVPLQWAMTQNNLGNALSVLGERESGTARVEEAVAAFREALQENTRARAARLGRDPDESRKCALTPRRAGGRNGAARGGRFRLSRSLAGKDSRARAARMGHDPDESRQCARNARRAGERDGAARRGRFRLSRGLAGKYPRARAAPMGRDPIESRHCARGTRRAGERDGAAGGSRRRLSQRLAGKDPRARAARMGHDPGESRPRALASRRAGERDGKTRRGRRRLSRSLAGIYPRARRSNGPRPRTILGLRFGVSASGRAERRGSRMPSQPFAKPCRNLPARACRSNGP
jgi:hypothetical protein